MIEMSPASWLQFLLPRLEAQWDCCKTYDDYYNGKQRLAFATAKFREAFSRYFPPLANNWMKLVCEAPVSRLKVLGFRFNPDPRKATWDQEADWDAWELWQANNMDAVSRQVHLEAIKSGVAYVLVTPNDPFPLMTAEHPCESYVYCDPSNHRNRLAAIKRYIDDVDGYAYAYVYLPTVVHKWRSADKYQEGTPWNAVNWVRSAETDPVINNPLGVVPMVPIENTPDMRWGGRSDLEVATPIQDAVNKFCLDMQVSSEFHAYPQRWATGWERGEDAEGNELTGRQVELLSAQTRLWRAESPETKFGQLEPGHVENYIHPIEMYVDHLAAVTQTPAYYLKGKMANLSADALHAADAGLVDRCRAKIDGAFSDNWEEVMRTAFLAEGDTERGKATTAETIWADPETKSINQLVDAAVKMRAALSVPVEMTWELLGWEPQKIQQAKQMMGLPDSPAAAKAAAGASLTDLTPTGGTATGEPTIQLPPGVRVH